MPGAKWQRGGEFPCVYSEFSGKGALSGVRFTVQDVPDDLHEAVLDHMSSIFLRDEPLCSYSGLKEDPVSLQEIRALWKSMLDQRAALVALVHDDAQGTPPRRRIAGANVTGVVTRADKEGVKAQFKGVAINKVISALDHIERLAQPDVFTRYGVDAYLTALGLSVDPEFRGQGLGDALLKARWPLCRNVGLKLTVTVFTATPSQILAKRAGFETLAEVQYKDYPEKDFHGREMTCMLLMAAPIN